jgi:hypothetical protein
MSRYDSEKKIKKQVAKDEETILNIGKEGKEGVKYAKEYFKNEEKREADIKAVEKEILSKKKKDREYIAQLAKMLIDRLYVIELPKQWSFQVAPTDKGVVMELFDGKKYFRSAFKVTFMKDVDMNAVDVFALRAMHTADRQQNVSPGGILLK